MVSLEKEEAFVATEAFEACDSGTLDSLRALVESCHCAVPGELPPALACLVGHFGYETIGLVEKLPRPPQGALDVPDMLFVRPTVLLVFDRLSDALLLKQESGRWRRSRPPRSIGG